MPDLKRSFNKTAAHQRYKLPDGTIVPGASTVCKLGDSPDALIAWSHQCGLDGIDYKKSRDNAADIGSLTHFIVECHLRNNEADLSEFSQADQDKAHICFDKFLKFWQREGMEWRGVEHQLVSSLGYGGTLDVAASRYNEMVVVDWKGLSIDTLLPTPDGFSRMDQIEVGDTLFDDMGNACSVMAASPIMQKPCHRIVFDDCSTVVCDEDHLWETATGYSRKGHEVSIKSTREIAATLRNQITSQRDHRVRLAMPIDLPERPLLIHPYVLGAWLGDGTASCGSITKPNPDLWLEIERCGYLTAPARTGSTSESRVVYGLLPQLRNLNVLNNKHIPRDYLRASPLQRHELLCGIMDTDGTWNKTRKQAVYETVDWDMALQVHELACSLGIRATIFSGEHEGFGKKIMRHRVSFSNSGMSLFRVRNKGCGLQATARGGRRMIVSCDSIPSVPTKCIQVNSPSALYLCTENFIPTHNTSSGIYRSHRSQIAGYSHLWDTAEYEMIDGKTEPRQLTLDHRRVTRAVIVRIGKKAIGDFSTEWLEREDIDAHIELFVAQLALYNVMRKLK